MNTDKQHTFTGNPEWDTNKSPFHNHDKRTIPAEKPTHSPLPWQVAEYGIAELKAKYLCIKHGDKTIARIDASGNSLSVTKQDEANARLIVASVNHADKLAEALREAKQDLIDIQRDCDTGEFEIDPQFAIDRITAKITAYEAATRGDQ